MVDPLDDDVKKMRMTLQNRELYTVCLPKKMAALGRSRKYIMVVIVLLAAIVGGLYYTQHELYTQRTLP